MACKCKEGKEKRASSQKAETPTFKIILIGDPYVGKTAMIH